MTDAAINGGDGGGRVAHGARLEEEAACSSPGRATRSSPQEIATCLQVPLGDVKLSTFANGEMYCRYGESIRGADVFVMQSHCEPINDRIMRAADHDRRGQAGVGAAHHRGLPVLRVRPPGPEGRGPRADHRAPARRPAHRRGRRPRRHRRPAHRARSRASSTSRSTTSPRCRCSPSTWPREVDGDVVDGRRPTPAAASSPAGSPTASARPTSRPTSRSSTSADRRARTTSPRPTEVVGDGRGPRRACSSTT